jgi:spectrin alpha
MNGYINIWSFYRWQLMASEHYDSPGIDRRREEVLGRWQNLKEALLANRERLGEAQSLQQFSRDVDEMEIWITEKLQTAMDESYKDPSNIQVSVSLVNCYEIYVC